MTNPPRSSRLNLRADTAPPSRFDGGWWPRSTDLAAELPGLARDLAVRTGGVTRIRYNPDNWGLLARHMTVDGRVVRLEGFTRLDPYSLRITGTAPGVLCLLVVPPDAIEHTGYAALAAAVTQNGLSRDILAACGAIRTADEPATFTGHWWRASR
ncbi:DUF5994 family protein [Actinocrispum wychmicini]|uniref:Uncharacterized protein n=1 Tax=Actinocrispum wychmicini TaxID=1213861 RepID=A0A4R2JR92_9PSEU|nr:DUF5994 family protein [Actinocrispum wychmicini]TCO59736.1 hypothetical protein EV192_104579 [Actinocrispum wychmicini]